MKQTYKYYSDMVNRYSEYFKRCNVNADKLIDLQTNYQITETLSRYNGRKLTERKTIVISAEYYANSISAIGFFKDRVYKSYTMPGYIMTKVSCTELFTGERVTREYNFIPVK